MKILILSCSTGGGHNTCAKYIKEELTLNNIENNFEDFYDIVNANAKELSSKLYLSSLSGDGKIFKNVYKLGELYSKTGIKSPVYLVNKLHTKKLYNYIISNSYDLVITTHLFPSLTLTAINKYYEKKIPFITIATDYEPCPFIEETKPNYLIMQKYLEDRFINKGIEKQRLITTGIPISTNFIKSAKKIKKELNITNEKLILVMLGSMGFGNIKEILSDLLEIPNIKVAIICGTNKTLYTELNELKNENLIVYGYTNNINDLIYSSDIVLSKPGGLSSTEIATIGKPLLHIFPIPGIETYNTNFFANHNMSFTCNTKNEIIANINKLLNDNTLAEGMVKNQHKYINQNSAKDLVSLIEKEFK